MPTTPKKSKPQRQVGVKKKGANGYKLPDPIPAGEVVTDLLKRKWKIGPSVGIGGFGEIYAVSDASSDNSKYSYVMKIEPHENGPLFVEMHFYMKVAKQSDIQEWMKKKNLKFLGIPVYVASGSHMYNNKKYRFLVMERLGQDLWSLFLQNNRQFPLQTVLIIGIQILDVLEYIHSKSYVHGDIKGSNILLGTKRGTENKVYLVDFGLAVRYSTQEYKENPKMAHNGTIEYTSRDAHVGVPTRRGDLEILAYNMLQWVSSELPWEKKTSQSPEVLKNEKIKYMNDITSLMKTCFKKNPHPNVLFQYFTYIAGLAPLEEPDYDYCRTLFKDGLKKCGFAKETRLQFNSASPQKPKRTTRATKRNAVVMSSSDEEDKSPKKITAYGNNKGHLKPIDQLSPEEMSFSFENSESDEAVSSKNVKPKKNIGKKPADKFNSQNKDNQGNISSSWKQCPTILSSNILRPGEYKRTNVND